MLNLWKNGLVNSKSSSSSTFAKSNWIEIGLLRHRCHDAVCISHPLMDLCELLPSDLCVSPCETGEDDMDWKKNPKDPDYGNSDRSSEALSVQRPLVFLSWRSGQVPEPFSVDTRGDEESICCSARFALGDELIG